MWPHVSLFRLIGILQRRRQLDMAAPCMGSRSMPVQWYTASMGAGIAVALMGVFFVNGTVLLLAATLFVIGILGAAIDYLLDRWLTEE